MLTPEYLISRGYKLIKSEAFAYQLLRWEIKNRAVKEDRNYYGKNTWAIKKTYRTMLKIKVGNWYKLAKTRTNPRKNVKVLMIYQTNIDTIDQLQH